MEQNRDILNKEVAEQKLHRLALEIAENIISDDVPLILIGVRHSGMAVAQKIGAFLQPFIKTSLEIISVSFNKHHPAEIVLSKEIDFNDKSIIIIDDVC
ncbi:MAG: phosphoribosyltransferase, partial [Panacibacter sp.]